MTEYLLINHGKGSPKGWEMFFEKLIGEGNFIGGSSLDEGIAVTNGVFGEALSKTITGYILIQAESLDQARDIAARCPVHLAGGTVEIFPLVRD